MGYKYCVVGYNSIYSNRDFSSLKNELFYFQQAYVSNELEFVDAVFDGLISFGRSISKSTLN